MLIKMNSYQKGLFAEFLAELLLRIKFYKILERRYKTKCGEIDIIAQRGNLLLFVEVKRRSTEMEAKEAITQKNRQRIEKTALLFLSKHSKCANMDVRYDVIWFSGKGLWPKHQKDAWRTGVF